MAALLWIVALVAGFLFVPWERFTDELTVYRAICIEKGRSETTCPGFIPLGRTTYKIELGSTEVISWRPDANEASLTRLKGCSVRSSRNWSCKAHGGAGKVSVKAGLRRRTGAAGVTRWRLPSAVLPRRVPARPAGVVVALPGRELVRVVEDSAGIARDLIA